MANEHPDRTKDTSEYAPSKAPDTRQHAEERTTESDDRLQPGGPRGTPQPTGMSALDRDAVPNGANKDEKLRIGEMRRDTNG